MIRRSVDYECERKSTRTTLFDNIQGGVHNEMKLQFVCLRVEAPQIKRIVLKGTSERKKEGGFFHPYRTSHDSHTSNHIY